MKRMNGFPWRTSLAALTAAIIVLVTLASCQDFFGTADLKDSIRQEVVVATADNVPLTVQPDPDVPGGTTSLSTTTQKVGVPFDLNVTVFAEYAFVGWSEPSGTGAVTFATETEPFTTATITEAADGIVIQANFTRRPELEASDPFNYAESVFKNKTILLYFSKPMDPSTVSFDTISLTHKPYGSSEPAESIAERYHPPAPATGNLLFRLVLKDGETLSETHIVTLRISRTVTDEAGNQMAEDAVITFIVSNEEDDVPPQWEATDPFTVRRADGTLLGTGNATNSASLLLRPRAFDNDIVVRLYVEETDGLATYNWDGTYQTAMDYTLMSTEQGTHTLTAQLEDASGNKSVIVVDPGPPEVTDPDTRFVEVVLDTVQPVVPTVAGSDAPYENAGTYYYQTGGVDFTFDSSDATSGLAGFTTDGAGSNPQSTVNLTVTDTVYAVDHAGNVSDGLEVTVDQDNTDPTISGDTVTGPAGPWVVEGETFSISFNATDTGGSQLAGTPVVTVTTGGDPVTNSVTVSGSEPNYTALVVLGSGDTNGAIRYRIDAEDNVGNTETTGSIDSLLDYDNIDPTQPSVATNNADYVGGGTYYYDSGGVNFTFSSIDTGSGVAGFTLDSGGSNPQSSINLTVTDTVYAVDTAGNVSAGRVVNVEQDTTGPTEPSVAGDDADYDDGSTYYYITGGVNFTFSSTDGGTGVAGFTTDSGGSNPQSSINLTVTDTVYAVDNMDNVSTGHTVTVVQDNTGPTISNDTVTSPAGATANPGDTFAISFNVTDGGSGMSATPSVSVTSGGVPVANSVTVSGSGPGYSASVLLDAADTSGAILFAISAEDNAGNSSLLGPKDSGVTLN